jgi:cytidine deaminase
MNRSELNESLIRAALDARDKAYAPYSKFAVGAALADSDGVIHLGSNVENASFGLTVCAERVAIWNAVSKGVRSFEGMAIATDGGLAPCGACRQVLAEFAKELVLLLVDAEHTERVIEVSLNELLPMRFDLP